MELEPIMSPQTLYAAIEALVTRAANHHDAGEAMRFAQAALNLAHIGSLGIVEPSTHTTDE